MQDHGPFPLFHMDFGPPNIVVDDAYNVLGVIDWDDARSVPWECVSFPMTLMLVPAPMDAPWNYDENGIATDEETRTKINDTIQYIKTVQEVERSKGLSSLLSGRTSPIHFFFAQADREHRDIVRAPPKKITLT